MARVVGSVLVHDQRADEAAELDQRVPVATVAREPGRLDREHGADTAFAYGRQQALEPWSGDSGSRPAKIVVDDDHIAPAELPGPVGKTILPSPALVVVQQLICRRLADVHIRAAGQMVRRDLGHAHPPPPTPCSPSSSPAAALGPTAALSPADPMLVVATDPWSLTDPASGPAPPASSRPPSTPHSPDQTLPHP